MAREMAGERGRELREAAARHRLARTAAGAAVERRSAAVVVAERPARWLVRLVGATLRH